MGLDYKSIILHYENCLTKFGDTHLGVDWPNKEDADLRYKIMLELIKEREKVSLLDFGCGTSHLYEYILQNKIENIEYAGLDMSERFINVAMQKFSNIKYYRGDLLRDELELPFFDYAVMNGVFTEKIGMSYDDMFVYFTELINKVFSRIRKGLAFNVMSKQVDWEREDLFHLPMDELATFLTKYLSRHFVIRHDYKLYEYTVYVYRNPTV